MSNDKVLSLGPSWGGNMVMAHSLFQTLKQSMSSISLVNSLKSAFLTFAADIPKRIGFLGEIRYGLLNDIRQPGKMLLAKTVDRFVALGLNLGKTPQATPQAVLHADQPNGLLALEALGIKRYSDKVLGLCPGWQVISFGYDKNKSISQAIHAQTHEHCIDLGGKTALCDTIDIMALRHTVISNDSGLIHVSAALDKKLVAIFGSSDPSHTPQIQPQAILNRLQYD